MARSRIKPAAAILILLATALGGLFAAAAWEWRRSDPERLITRPLPQPRDEVVEEYGGEGCLPGRRCLDVTVGFEDAPALRFAVSLPEAAVTGGTPALILAGGFETGREALKYLPDPGPNAVITYEYPVDKQRWKQAGKFGRLIILRSAATTVPRQLALLLGWVRGQPWTDPERISLVGVSLGALLLPAARRIAEVAGEPSGPTIMAFGAVQLNRLVEANLKVEPFWLRAALADLAGLAVRAIEPASHLGAMKGELLLINGSRDKLIPVELARALHALAPEPKRVVMLPLGHLYPGEREVLDRILTISRDWLLELGAVVEVP